MDKKTPNPYGKLGSPQHLNLIQKLYDYFKDKGKGVKTEKAIEMPDKSIKYADLAVLDENGKVVEYHQIGKQNKDGTPVARERRAIEEIEKATGKKVWFHPYNVVIAVILLVGLMLAASAA